MSTEVRGFHYALEPLRKRQTWHLERVQANLGLATREVVNATGELERRNEQLGEQHTQVLDGLTQSMDPALHRHGLRWLVRLREEIAIAQTLLQELRDKRSRLQADYRVQQNKLAVIDRHRDACLVDYALTQQNRSAAAADSEWLARLQVVALSGSANKAAVRPRVL